MLIRKSQILAFSEEIKRSFEEDLTRRLLRSRRQDRFTSLDDALPFVQGEIQRALLHGITSEEALEKYVAASWLMGAPIDQHNERLRRLIGDVDLAQYHRAMSALAYAEERSGAPDV
ncbi:uncharacterized protein SOCE26_004400 [Sorangium cellulosum]|uniref:Uncharacterized protein n=1 Tax=Sorangium cellulosum TaxID=56 RepID=A0A2L0EIC9_SORCE|nr:hypothetical protein [Sorangium cellulosum]AUX39058.1 uncharacterized protein SOCE26_004400 [Sorangium cellulosum]